MSSTLRVEPQNPPDLNNPADWPLEPLKCQLAYPETDWDRSWRLARLKGLDPELKSFVLKMLWGIIPTRSRLHRIMSYLYPTPDCQLCGGDAAPPHKTLQRAMLDCQANQGLPGRLLKVLQVYQPGAEQRHVLTLDLSLDTSLELPMTWVIGSLLLSIWRQRSEGRVNLAKTRAELEAKCRILREGKVRSLTNAYALTAPIVQDLFREDVLDNV